MGYIIFIDEFRKKRCLEALLAHIGLPPYCAECGDLPDDTVLDTHDIIFEQETRDIPHAPPPPARILLFQPRAPQLTASQPPRRKTAGRSVKTPAK